MTEVLQKLINSGIDYITWDIAQILDLDWWAIDLNGCVGHFASGCAPIPKGLRVSIQKQLDVFFYEQVPIIADPLESSGWETYAGFSLAENIGSFKSLDQRRTAFFRSYAFMGARGMYSYTADPKRNYCRVIIPSTPIYVQNIPKEFQQYLCTFKFDIRFSESPIISFDQISPSPLKSNE
ncbi:MAG: hypothetical protein LBE13_12385 [Bacteroidales bacterium]|nr:hypothetical protein [Bacteroidales bacterium]